MTESQETKDARIDWTLQSIGEKLCAVETNQRNLNHLILGNPANMTEKGILGTQIDQGGDIAWTKKFGGWFVGIITAAIGYLFLKTHR